MLSLSSSVHSSRYIAEGVNFDYIAVKDRAAPRTSSVPEVHIGKPNMSQYDQMIEAAR